MHCILRLNSIFQLLHNAVTLSSICSMPVARIRVHDSNSLYFFPLHLSASQSYIDVIEIPLRLHRYSAGNRGPVLTYSFVYFCDTICAIAIDPITSISIKEARLLRSISVPPRMALNPFTRLQLLSFQNHTEVIPVPTSTQNFLWHRLMCSTALIPPQVVDQLCRKLIVHENKT